MSRDLSKPCVKCGEINRYSCGKCRPCTQKRVAKYRVAKVQPSVETLRKFLPKRRAFETKDLQSRVELDNKVLPRSVAIEQGLNVYFTGKPCKKGHVSCRSVLYRQCCACTRENSLKYLTPWSDIPEDVKEKQRERNRAYKKEFSARQISGATRQKIATLKGLTELNRFQMELIYIVRDELNKIHGPKSFEVDHKVPLKGKIVCGVHAPWNLKVMPKNLNSAKTNKYEGEFY